MGMSLFQEPETPGLYAYLQSKAKRYLEVGLDAYREGDFFDMLGDPYEGDQEKQKLKDFMRALYIQKFEKEKGKKSSTGPNYSSL